MFIERTALAPDLPETNAAISQACMGCEDCDGPCQEFLQMLQLPLILQEIREKRA